MLVGWVMGENIHRCVNRCNDATTMVQRLTRDEARDEERSRGGRLYPPKPTVRYEWWLHETWEKKHTLFYSWRTEVVCNVLELLWHSACFSVLAPTAPDSTVTPYPLLLSEFPLYFPTPPLFLPKIQGNAPKSTFPGLVERDDKRNTYNLVQNLRVPDSVTSVKPVTGCHAKQIINFYSVR
jgi:hypothetical protein